MPVGPVPNLMHSRRVMGQSIIYDAPPCRWTALGQASRSAFDRHLTQSGRRTTTRLNHLPPRPRTTALENHAACRNHRPVPRAEVTLAQFASDGAKIMGKPHRPKAVMSGRAIRPVIHRANLVPPMFSLGPRTGPTVLGQGDRISVRGCLPAGGREALDSSLSNQPARPSTTSNTGGSRRAA